MKRHSQFIACALGLTTVVTTAWAEDNAYTRTIAGRNAFGLVDPPPPKIDVPPTPPLPQVTLQGVTSLLGRWQVLLKVAAPAKPGEPPRDVGHVLNAGEAADGVQVLGIDGKSGTVRLDNHGTVQTLSLKDDADKPAPKPGVDIPPSAPRLAFRPLPKR